MQQSHLAMHAWIARLKASVSKDASAQHACTKLIDWRYTGHDYSPERCHATKHAIPGDPACSFLHVQSGPCWHSGTLQSALLCVSARPQQQPRPCSFPAFLMLLTGLWSYSKCMFSTQDCGSKAVLHRCHDHSFQQVNWKLHHSQQGLCKNTQHCNT